MKGITEIIFLCVKRQLTKEESEQARKWYWNHHRPTTKIIIDHPEWLGFEI